MSYFRRYEDLYTTDCANWSDSKKVPLLLRKLGTTKHTKFIKYILPRKASELTFAEAVELIMEIFSPKKSLFHKRWRCLNLTRKKEEDYTTFASEANKHCDDFRLAELSVDIFRCLIFMQGPVSTKDVEIRRRNKLEKEPNITLQQIAEDCQRYVRVKPDSKKLKNWVLLTSKKYDIKSLPLKLMKQRKSKIFCPLAHVPDVGPYTGTKIVLSGTKSASYVIESDTKACIVDLKIKPIVT